MLDDVLDGFVTREAALRDYGVVVVGDTIDEAATARAREAQSSRPAPFFTFGPEREAYEAGWTQPVWDRFSTLLFELPPMLRSDARRRLWTDLDRLRLEGTTLTPQVVADSWQQLRRLPAAGARS